MFNNNYLLVCREGGIRTHNVIINPYQILNLTRLSHCATSLKVAQPGFEPGTVRADKWILLITIAFATNGAIITISRSPGH